VCAQIDQLAEHWGQEITEMKACVQLLSEQLGRVESGMHRNSERCSSCEAELQLLQKSVVDLGIAVQVTGLTIHLRVTLDQMTAPLLHWSAESLMVCETDPWGIFKMILESSLVHASGQHCLEQQHCLSVNCGDRSI